MTPQGLQCVQDAYTYKRGCTFLSEEFLLSRSAEAHG